MKTFRVTWVEKAYYVIHVDAESEEAARALVESDFDAYFLGKKPVDYDNETYYDLAEPKTIKGA